MIDAKVGLAVVAVLLSSCTTLQKPVERSQGIPLNSQIGYVKPEKLGAVYVWPPYASAAIVDGEGNRCVLAASGAKTVNVSNEAALKIGKLLNKVDGLDASTKETLLETFTKTSGADAKAAAIDVALFHLCILEQNGTFSDKNAEKRAAVMRAYEATIAAFGRVP